MVTATPTQIMGPKVGEGAPASGWASPRSRLVSCFEFIRSNLPLLPPTLVYPSIPQMFSDPNGFFLDKMGLFLPRDSLTLAFLSSR